MSSDVPPSDAVARTSPGIRWPEAFAALSAAVMATFDVFNTSIGWHLASGRWMLEHGRVVAKGGYEQLARHEGAFVRLAAQPHRRAVG